MQINYKYLLVGLLVGVIILIVFSIYYKGPTESKSSYIEGYANINMRNTTDMKYPLIDYFIKASAHSAYDSDSNQVSLTQLKTVIRRGYRWLDFDVFSVDHQPVVGFAYTPGTQTSESKNTLPFDSVMEEVFKSALTTSGCPNSKDPLFINLRVRSPDTAIYPGITQSMSNNFGSALHTNFIDPLTLPLSKLAGKVVFVLDILNSDKTLVATGDDSYQEHADVKSLRSIAGLLCGHSRFPLTTQSSQLKISPVQVPRDDPRTLEINMQRQMMGYNFDSFVSAPMISRDITIENITTEEDKEDMIDDEEDEDMVEEYEDMLEDDEDMVEGLTSKAKKIKRRAAQAAKKSKSTARSVANKSKPAAKKSKQAVKQSKQAVKRIKEIVFKGMRDTSATHFRCSIPDFVNPNSATNPSVFLFIADYGIQVVPFRFYKDDTPLTEYELLFENNGQVAFMRLSKAILLANQSRDLNRQNTY